MDDLKINNYRILGISIYFPLWNLSYRHNNSYFSNFICIIMHPQITLSLLLDELVLNLKWTILCCVRFTLPCIDNEEILKFSDCVS